MANIEEKKNPLSQHRNVLMPGGFDTLKILGPQKCTPSTKVTTNGDFEVEQQQKKDQRRAQQRHLLKNSLPQPHLQKQHLQVQNDLQ